MKEHCVIRGCTKPAGPAGLCRKTHAVQRADKLFSALIRERDRRCQVCRSKTGLQCAHLVSRRYRAVRWDVNNAVALCLRCHKRYTEAPLEWDEWCSNRLGAEFWQQMKWRAINSRGPDLEAVLVTLAAA